ncbi:MAG: hypothetical protein OXI46_05695 [Gemmatimonadota bacterium]|nr:hypothetical protein [Gemmatimonadota bacterium]
MSNDMLTPLGARVSAVLPFVGAAAMAGSVAYDWGYLGSLGISFREAPTSVLDHARSWLIWVPGVALAILFLITVEMALSRAEGGMSEDELVSSSPNPNLTRRSRELPFTVMAWAAVVGVVLWLLFAEIFPMARIGIPIAWIVFAGFVFRHPRAGARFSEYIGILIFGPPVLFGMFIIGAELARLEMASDAASHRIELRPPARGPESVRLLRTFHDWTLVRDGSGAVVWIPSSEIVRIQRLEAHKPFKGFICKFFDRGCAIIAEPVPDKPAADRVSGS